MRLVTIPITPPVSAALFAAFLSAAPAGAQGADSARAGARPLNAQPLGPSPNATVNDGCTYDACALRIEEGAVLQGADARRVASLGVFGSLGRRVPWRSDMARRFAQSAQAQHRGARVLQLVGLGGQLAGLVLAGAAVSEARDQVAGAASGDGSGQVTVDKTKLTTGLGLTLGGTVLGGVGGLLDSHARKLLARAVWWNNRELAGAR